MVDTLWIAIAAILVFVMQACFLCLESGLVRSKNSINVAAKNISDFTLTPKRPDTNKPSIQRIMGAQAARREQHSGRNAILGAKAALSVERTTEASERASVRDTRGAREVSCGCRAGVGV